MEKKCSKCGEEKPIEMFSRNRATKSGLNHWCKKCQVIINRRYKYKTYTNESNKRNKKRLKDIKDKYGLGGRTIKTFGLKTALFVYDRANRKCEVCGNVNDLTIHHKDHNGRNNQNVGLPMNNDVNNLTVLCRSCHGRLHANKLWEKRRKYESYR